jgi:hypothetical protein
VWVEVSWAGLACHRAVSRGVGLAWPSVELGGEEDGAGVELGRGSRAGGGRQSGAGVQAADADGRGRQSSDAIWRLTTRPSGGEGTEEPGITKSGDDDAARGRRRPDVGGRGSI